MMHQFKIILLLIVLVALSLAAKKTKEADPKDCEVCIKNLEEIDKMIKPEDKNNKEKIERALGTHCTLSGFGSDWKPNPALTSPKDVKMCYIFEPIKKAISTPFATGMPKKKVCERLKKDNPDICEIKYPVKVEKKEGEAVDYNKLKIKELKQILQGRNVECKGCTEKSEFVRRCQETEGMEL